MASLIDEFNAMKIKVAKAMALNDQATLNRKIHVVDHEAERERKRTNPNKSTKVYFNCYSPDAWREFQTQKDRYFELAVDPHIAVDLMVRALTHFTDEQLRSWISEGHQDSGVPKAELPAWLRE